MKLLKPLTFTFLALSPYVMAEEAPMMETAPARIYDAPLSVCEQDKKELRRVQSAQLKMKIPDTDKSLFDLQAQQDKITADLILLRGLRDLHKDYEKFKTDAADFESDFYSKDFKKVKDNAYKNWRSVFRVASLNYLLEDLLKTDPGFRSLTDSKEYEGDFFEYLEDRCSGDENTNLSICNIVYNDEATTNPTLRTATRKAQDISSSAFKSAAREDAKSLLNGFYDAYAVSQDGKSDEDKKKALKTFRQILLTGTHHSNPGKTLDTLLKQKGMEVVDALDNASSIGIAAGSVKVIPTDDQYAVVEKEYETFRDCLIKSSLDVNVNCSPTRNPNTNKLANAIYNSNKFASESFKLTQEDLGIMEGLEQMTKKAKQRNIDSQKRVVGKMSQALTSMSNKNIRLADFLGKEGTDYTKDLEGRTKKVLHRICGTNAVGLFTGDASSFSVDNTKLKKCFDRINSQPDRLEKSIAKLEDKAKALNKDMDKIKNLKQYEKLQSIKRYATMNALQNCNNGTENVEIVSNSCGLKADQHTPIPRSLVDSNNRLITEIDFHINEGGRKYKADLERVRDACHSTMAAKDTGFELEMGQDPDKQIPHGDNFERTCKTASKDLHIAKNGTKLEQAQKFLKTHSKRWNGHEWIVNERKSTASMFGASLLNSGVSMIGPWIQYKSSGPSIEAMKNQAIYQKQYNHNMNQYYEWQMDNWMNWYNTNGSSWGTNGYYWGSSTNFYGGFPTYYYPSYTLSDSGNTTTDTSSDSTGYSW